MTQFENVTVIKKMNAYFDGKVTSRTVIFPDDSVQTLGVMLPGEYEFGTDEKELMEIMSGNLDVLLPEASDWQPFTGGQTFEVPACSKFKVKVREITDYCCSYIK